MAGVEEALFKVYVAGYGGHLCVAMEVRSGRLVLKPADPSNPEVMWAKRILLDQSFQLVNQASGQLILNSDILPRPLIVAAHYHPALLLAPARWMLEAEDAGVGGVADGGVRIVCVSAHAQKQSRLLPLKIAEWAANQQHGNNDDQMVLEAEEDHDAPSEEEEEEDEDGAGGAEEVTASPPSSTGSKRSRCFGCIRRLFACLSVTGTG